MLNHCLTHYSIDKNMALSHGLYQLHALNKIHYCGYHAVPVLKYNTSYNEAISLLAIDIESHIESISV